MRAIAGSSPQHMPARRRGARRVADPVEAKRSLRTSGRSEAFEHWTVWSTWSSPPPAYVSVTISRRVPNALLQQFELTEKPTRWAGAARGMREVADLMCVLHEPKASCSMSRNTGLDRAGSARCAIRSSRAPDPAPRSSSARTCSARRGPRTTCYLNRGRSLFFGPVDERAPRSRGRGDTSPRNCSSATERPHDAAPARQLLLLRRAARRAGGGAARERGAAGSFFSSGSFSLASVFSVLLSSHYQRPDLDTCGAVGPIMLLGTCVLTALTSPATRRSRSRRRGRHALSRPFTRRRFCSTS